jgi:hypothetical protein
MSGEGANDEAAEARRRRQIADAMHRVRPDEEYFAVTILADEKGEVVYDITGIEVETHPDRTGWEMREGRLVSPTLYDAAFGEGNYIVVHDEEQLAIWLAAGGACAC